MTRPRARSSRVVPVKRARPRPAPADQDSATPLPAAPRSLTLAGLMTAVPALIATLSPCCACQSRAAGSLGVCPDCAAAMRRAVAMQPPAAESLWLGPYAGVWLRAVHALKYRGARRLAPFLAELLALRVTSSGWSPQLVTHVPTTATRRRQRGYDQAELLATHAAATLGLPHAAALTRVRQTAKLAGQGRAARGAALAGAFSAHWVPYRDVLVIDDVHTSGATLAAARKALLAAGAGRVRTAVVARTAPPTTHGAAVAAASPLGGQGGAPARADGGRGRTF